MDLRGTIARWLVGTEQAKGGAPSASSELTNPDSATFWALSGTSGGSRVAVNERTAMSLPAVLHALEILTGVFAMTPMIYYRREAD
ncbi:MAG: hypothetical protein U1D06_08745, partial [Paracoccaceae bacterium]|nr:hypothetical protein [Paracoccaceae bacterium]